MKPAPLIPENEAKPVGQWRVPLPPWLKGWACSPVTGDPFFIHEVHE